MLRSLVSRTADCGLIKIAPTNESPPCKKLRLGDRKPDIQSPLRVDTDKARGPAYNPQVEAISPTLPSESLRDESPLRSTKEELLSQIARVDREIAKTESQIAKLKKKKVELEEAATQPEGYAEESSNASDSIIRSLPQSLYAENRKKAYQAHQTLDKLGPKVELPLYNQPSDTKSYHENKLKYAEFRTKLLDYFRIRLKEKQQRETYLTTTYVKLSLDWSRKLEKLENSAKKRMKEAKNRDTFEKIFPELRKQREDKERFSRVGSRIKSDADLEEIMDGLHEQELEDKKMRSYAVIPPILLDERARKRRFTNRNGLIEDPMQEYKDKQLLNVWTDQEKDIFKEKYLQHPKNFGIIKSYMERKNVSDCVQYYYLSKKAQNYRQLLRKNRARTRSTRNQHNTVPCTTIPASGITGGFSIIKPEPNNGVTTRQQKEQKSDVQPSGTSSNGSAVLNNLPEEMNNIHLEIHPGLDGNEENIRLEGDGNLVTQVSQSSMQSDYTTQVKKKGKHESKELHDEMDTSEEENIVFNGDKGGTHPYHHCAICKERVESYLNSRPLFRTQASQYGLNEEDIHSGDRVCTSCRCKSVRRRYKPSQCPIPTCPTRRARTKRLRPFPSKWSELSEEIKEAICAKYQIPVKVTKCCTACFNRISRRLNPNTSLDTPDDPGSDTTSWTEEEIDAIKRSLVEVGTDWRQLSERIVTKSDLQCRNFYFNFRKIYGLDTLVLEFKKSKGGDGPPILTDEEESGSTTSSCDEGTHPSHNQPTNSSERKDEYDSSATVSAEEGGSLEMEKPNLETPKSIPTHPDSTLQLPLRSGNTAGQPGVDSISHANQIRILQPNRSLATQHQGRAGHLLSPQVSYQSPSSSRESHRIMGSPHGPHHSTISHQLSAASSSPSPRPTLQPHPSPISSQPSTSHTHIMSQHMAADPHQHMHMTSSSHSGMRYPSPDGVESHEQMTVKDLMLATIERQLRRNPAPSTPQNIPLNQTGAPPEPSVSPTITSILKSQDRTHLPPQSQQHMNSNQHIQTLGNPSQQIPNMQIQQPLFQPHPLYYASKMDVRGGIPHHLIAREGLPVQLSQGVVQVSRDEYETLDLSMKKRTPSPHVNAQRLPSDGPPPAHQPLDYATRQEVYPKYSPLGRSRVSHTPINKIPPKLPPPPLLTKPPTTSPLKDGSITQGTPIQISHSLPSKYEGLLRPMKEGSIIQGTPLDKIRSKETVQSPYMYGPGRPTEYYKVMPAPYYHNSPLQNFSHGQRPQPAGQRSPSATPVAPYPVEQHTTSRQSIINDYYTSQQMQQPPPSSMQQHMQSSNPREMSKRLVPPPGTPGHAVYLLPQRIEVTSRQSPPLNSLPHNQQRQGVIHRTSINRPPVKADTGRFQQHDAFASLVDIAAAQPSLPVPNEEPRPRIIGMPRVEMVREGLGRSIAEMEERNRANSGQVRPASQIFRGGTVQPNHSPDESRSRKQIENRYNRELQDSTLTAATLIDAIITRQINQPSTQDRQSTTPPTTRTGDRLFASLQRSLPGGVQHSHTNVQSAASLESVQQQDESKLENANTTGGTWGDQIDLIISKDYASAKGISGGPNPGLQKGTLQNAPAMSTPSTDSSKQDEMGKFVNWKLRRALQHEREQQENQNQSDERHIIRVAQTEQHSKLSQPGIYISGDHGPDTKELPTSTTVSSLGSNDALHFARNGGGREGIISPLDYVKNRIVEVMRTENKDDKSEETSSSNEQVTPGGGSLQVGSSAVASAAQNALPCSSTSPQMEEPCTSTCGQGSSTSALHDKINTAYDKSSSSILDERRTSMSDKGAEADSPQSMVIDESVDEKEKPNPSNEQASSTTPNNPNYEPLTDEET